MLNNTGDRHLENLSLSAQVLGTQKQLLVQRYLQSPFSIPWSKLASVFQPDQALSQPEVIETNQSEQYESDSIREQDSYPHFTDRVDPSLYYSIFFPPRAI